MSDRLAVMDHGKVLQVGTPTEIYEAPLNRFVADFIGETNLLSARLVACAAGEFRFRLDSGIELTGREDGGHDVGTRVTLAVRPERADISAQAAPNGLPGRIEQLVYFGTDTQYRVRLNDDSTFLVRRQNRGGRDGAFNEGDEIVVSMLSDALRVLQD